jgi:hypothetical protein
MEQHEIVRICWDDATPDEEAINAAFREAGALDPAITVDDSDDDGLVRVEFDYVSTGTVNGVEVAAVAANSLGKVSYLERLTA